MSLECIDMPELNAKINIESCDSLTILKEVNLFTNSLIEQGFLNTEFIKALKFQNSCIYRFQANTKFNFQNITVKGREARFSSLLDMKEFIRNELESYENSGYPFCRLTSSLKVDSTQVLGELIVDKGPLILFDSLEFLSENKLNYSLIRNALELEEGKPYSEKLVQEISARIDQIPYLKLTKPPSVIFIKNRAKVFLQLEKINSKSFTGIVGVQPNTNQTTSLTGEINLNLLDAFNRGETVKFNWQRINNGTQELTLQSEIPYLFKSKLGIGGQIQIYRKDSLVNRFISNFDLIYDFTPRFNAKIGLISQRNNTNLTESSDFTNTQSTGYKIELEYQSIDKLFNPRKGVYLKGSGSAGRRNLNGSNSPLTILEFKSSAFIPMFERSAGHIFVKSHANLTKNLLQNELEQIGGLGTIRGLDHRSIFVSEWLTAGAEYRFLFEENSNFILFAEQNYFESKTESESESGGVLAVGLGLNVGTQSGIFNFFYSLAKNQSSSFNLNQGKINFGFISEF